MRYFLILPLFFLFSCTVDRGSLGNVFRTVIVSKVKGFDPAQVSDLYSHIVQKQVYEALYQYKYLVRPYDIEPCLAESLPQISPNGLIYTIRLKRGIYFTDDPCFPNGKGREINARDFIHSLKRLADVRTKTTGWWLFHDKIEGLDEFREYTKKLKLKEKVDYFSNLKGLSALNDSLIEIRLKKPCPYFKYILTMAYVALYPHEAVEYYGEEFLNHPVGTGPFILKEWRRGLRLVYERNPKYKHGFYPTAGEPNDSKIGLLEDAGKQLPFIDRLEMHVFIEYQPMILNFLRGNVELSAIPKDNYESIVTPEKTLRPQYQAKGIVLRKTEDLDLVYTSFNHEDTLLGKNRKLRQAISLAFNAQKTIDLFYNGRAIPAQSLLPPGIFGYDPDFKNPFQDYNVEKAKKLLAEAGFPNGKGLPTFEYLNTASTTSRQWGEKFVSEMAAVGIKIKINSVTWPEFLKRLKERQYQIAGAAWMADYPDPENFLMLLYGPNKAPGENTANYKNPEYDSLFKEISVLSDCPERLKAIRRMKEIVARDCPWIFVAHRLSEGLTYQWVKNYKKLVVTPGNYKYYKIDVPLRKQLLAKD